MRAWRCLSRAACLLLSAMSGAAWAQVPAGPELQVNTFTSSSQYLSTAAMSGVGDFVVTWQGAGAPGLGVFGQRFSAAGVPRGEEFPVPGDPSGISRRGSVAADAAGNFVVAWGSRSQDVSSDGVVAQRFDAGGARVGFEFPVNSFTTGRQSLPAAAMGPAGDFVVAWMSDLQDGSDAGIFGQRFDRAGTPLGVEFRVNGFTTGRQEYPAVAQDGAGNFVVAWTSLGQDPGNAEVFAQLYDAAGSARGVEFRVNAFTTGQQLDASVAMDPAGDFVVVWTSFPEVQVRGQRFDPSGARLGAEFQVETSAGAYGSYPTVAMDASGSFVVAWLGQPGDGSETGVFGQRYDAAGARRGARFQVNTYTSGFQGEPSAAMDAVGNFVVTWTSYGQGPKGTSFDVFAQRFGGLQPAALAVDGPGNGVWEPGETAEVQPSWRNVNGSAQTVGGQLSRVTGPGGALYAIADGSATYGTVPDGGVGACEDCYLVSVSDPPARPLRHWDAAVAETLAPDVQGQVETWRLHIGRSFDDVPAASPYYRFVETLLHKGVTGGCSTTSYCPASVTTREQMAVFVLVAREGAGYAPAACTSPVFPDVPASSPYCRYVEELGRRGVVGGCGGGNYCPTAAVTREQMAVFALRTLDAALDPPACVAGAEQFADVPAGSPFCRWIEELHRRGVVSGCGGGNYCPTAPVTREQMGVFLGATFGLSLYGP